MVNDQPYRSERPYNALRLAGALTKRPDVELRVFLMGEAVGCAVTGQTVPEGTRSFLRHLLHRAQ
jgi:uncharacterized protein involved in oxidation of intracellular sulfur